MTRHKIPVKPPTARNFRKTEAKELTPPPEERIRIRAYELYEARNREPGHEEEDWFQAEAEIIARSADVAKR